MIVVGCNNISQEEFSHLAEFVESFINGNELDQSRLDEYCRNRGFHCILEDGRIRIVK